MKNNSKTILIVDDEPAIRLLLTEFFKNKYQTQTVDGGHSALEWLRTNPIPAAIILDLSMPDKNGLEVIRELRAKPEWNSIVVLVLSGKESSKDRIQCLREGADDYLVKPFNPEELDARLLATLRRVA